MYNSGTPSNTVTANGNVLVAPAAPTNLQGTVQTGPKVQLTWKDNATNETSYVIERSTNNGGTYTQIGTVNANVTSYTDSAVTPGSSYTYRVKALNGNSSSTYSNSVRISVPNAPSVPATPTNFSGQGFRGTALLYWNASSNATSYTIQYSTNSAFPTNGSTKSTSTTKTYTTITSLTRGTTYYLRIQAVNATGSSQWSNPITVKP
ncbi:fibronectin type III domain-containing protein [Neobacillus sp. PS3-12]|uniref:fibronectin type III domain-containing protein n=1 Tax=Neobacillus sp. PS3-12 TaxID=3070677 RepID=UPI0035A8A85F